MNKYIVQFQMPLYAVKANTKDEAEQKALEMLISCVDKRERIGCTFRAVDVDELNALYFEKDPRAVVICEPGNLTAHVDIATVKKVD